MTTPLPPLPTSAGALGGAGQAGAGQATASPTPAGWPGWVEVLANALVAPRSAFAPLARPRALLVPMAALAAAQYAGLFAHFAPSTTPAGVTLGLLFQGVRALGAALALAAVLWAGLAARRAAPPFAAVVTLTAATALWPTLLRVAAESAVVALDRYPAALNPRIDAVTALRWLAPPGASPALAAFLGALDVTALYRDALLVVGLPQLTPRVRLGTAAAVVGAVRLARIALATALT